MRTRVLLLMPTTTYKARDFMVAAERLGVEVVVGTERRQALEDQAPGTTMALDFDRPEVALGQIGEAHAREPFRAVVGTDDETTVLAAMAGEALGLRHNPPAAARDARNKLKTRRTLRAAGMRCPGFRRLALDVSPDEIARGVRYPCVLKPLEMAASRGVIRADDPAAFVQAFARVAAIIRGADRGKGVSGELLVEDWMAGAEVALEGLLDGGRLTVLALFDKPDPLDGPTFEETIFVTPSRLPDAVQSAIVRETEAGCRALGLREGPIHAELRLPDDHPSILEIAPRTIGGLCSRTLRFGTGTSLEELVLRHALGLGTNGLSREGQAAGVMMVPIPRGGFLGDVCGLESARAVLYVEEVTILIRKGSPVVPLPEGHQYLGFLFARGPRPADVEHALRTAHSHLQIDIQ